LNNRIQKTLDERKIGDTKVELLTFPIGQLFEEKEKINRKILNVIYILCMKERPIPRIPFKDLQKCTDKIVLLFSDEVAEWALDINEKKIEIKRVAQTRFYKEYKKKNCNGVQREHNKKLNNGLPILHKVPPKRDYGRYFCIMAEKGGTSHGGLTEKLSLFFHAKKQEVNAYGR